MPDKLSDFTYEATDEHMTFSAMGPQLVDFIRVVGLPKFLKEHLFIEKRKNLYPPGKLSQLLVVQNILGYDRIEGSRVLDQDAIRKSYHINNIRGSDPLLFIDRALHKK